MNIDTKQTWFLAQLKPNSHQIAQRNLLRQGFEVFLPMVDLTTRRNGQFKTQTKPVFPGYIFVGFGARSPAWSAVNATQGITKLVSFGDTPAPVPDGIIDALVLRYATPNQPVEDETFEAGADVRVSAGPFTDFIGQVESVAPDQRVWVLLELMGRKTRMGIPARDLRAT